MPVVRRRPATDRELERIWHAATAYIAAHYAQDITVEDVAAHAFASRRQVQRAFEAVGETTFRAYLRAVRMDVARKLLEGGHRGHIRDVAAAVAYRQPAQFAKAFRAHHGRNPSEVFTRGGGAP